MRCLLLNLPASFSAGFFDKKINAGKLLSSSLAFILIIQHFPLFKGETGWYTRIKVDWKGVAGMLCRRVSLDELHPALGGGGPEAREARRESRARFAQAAAVALYPT